MNQKTIKRSASFDGVGLHTGEMCHVTIHPAAANYGIRFVRLDLDKDQELLADVNYVHSTNRSTTLKNGNLSISTIEHLMSAIFALGVTNVRAEVTGPELPILDGSAQAYADALISGGIEDQEMIIEPLVIDQPLVYYNKETDSEYYAVPCDHFELTAMIDFDSEVLGQQFANLSKLEDYQKSIASSRTFVFLRDIAKLLNQDLIKGGDLDNALVIVEKGMSNDQVTSLAKKLGVPDLKEREPGIYSTSPQRFANEPARHKLLDVLGDLSLLGRPILGKFTIKKPGHTANLEFTKILKKKFQEQKRRRGMPRYDPTVPPLYDIEGIKAMLPHRYPFLLVDKIIEIQDDYVVGIKNVTFNENFFQGHFPDNPVFPGVLQIEAMAQTGGIFVLNQMDEPDQYDTYFLKIDKVKFKQKVLPGDTLVLKLELLSPIRRGLCHMQGTAWVGNTIVSEGELLAQVVKRDPSTK